MTARLAPRSAGAVTSGRLTDEERRWRAMTSTELQDLLIRPPDRDGRGAGLALVLGWETLHVRPGMRSKGRWWTATTGTMANWPDLVLVRERDRRLIFAELKKELEHPTEGQARVLDVLRSLEHWVHGEGMERRVEVFVWRPSDLAEPIETSRIYEVLR